MARTAGQTEHEGAPFVLVKDSAGQSEHALRPYNKIVNCHVSVPYLSATNGMQGTCKTSSSTMERIVGTLYGQNLLKYVPFSHGLQALDLVLAANVPKKITNIIIKPGAQGSQDGEFFFAEKKPRGHSSHTLSDVLLAVTNVPIIHSFCCA